MDQGRWKKRDKKSGTGVWLQIARCGLRYLFGVVKPSVIHWAVNVQRLAADKSRMGSQTCELYTAAVSVETFRRRFLDDFRRDFWTCVTALSFPTACNGHAIISCNFVVEGRDSFSFDIINMSVFLDIMDNAVRCTCITNSQRQIEWLFHGCSFISSFWGVQLDLNFLAEVIWLSEHGFFLIQTFFLLMMKFVLSI